MVPFGARGLPFDHDAIIAGAFRVIERELWIGEDVAKALLGERFTSTKAAGVFSALRAGFQRQNTNRTLSRWGVVECIGDTVELEGGEHPCRARPAGVRLAVRPR
jgi:hypothetical protein